MLPADSTTSRGIVPQARSGRRIRRSRKELTGPTRTMNTIRTRPMSTGEGRSGQARDALEAGGRHRDEVGGEARLGLAPGVAPRDEEAAALRHVVAEGPALRSGERIRGGVGDGDEPERGQGGGGVW